MTSTMLALFAGACVAGPLEQRIVHNHPDSCQLLSNVHTGAREKKIRRLLGLEFELSLCARWRDFSKDGIGYHFHHRMEKMSVIPDGEAEFTLNGRTTRLKGLVAVPCRMGQSHGLYNSSDKPIVWLNFVISSEKKVSGDMLPEATMEQKLTTGLCRNHMINAEGERIAETSTGIL